ncbi:WbqC family protein [Synechococcus sp. HB1133]
MQPNLFMWPGLLKSIIDSDVHIILDSVLASKNSRYNRNLIRGNISDTAKWFTLPFSSFSCHSKICDLTVNTSYKDVHKLLSQFQLKYKNAPYKDISLQILNNTFSNKTSPSGLVCIYRRFLESLKLIGIGIPRIYLASGMISDSGGLRGISLVNELLKGVDASIYLASKNTIKYADPSEYCVKKVFLQDFNPYLYEPYLNLGNHDTLFSPALSCLDMFAHMTVDECIDYLDKCNHWRIG